MATFPPATIPVFLDGFGPYPSDFNGWIQNNFSFLTGEVVLRARQTTVQALAIGSNQLNFQAIDEDPYSGWSAVATGSQPAMSWLAPVTGLYQVHVEVNAAASANWLQAWAGVSTAFVTLSEGGTANTAGSGAGGTGSFSLIAGLDYIEGWANVAAAVSTTIGAGVQSSLEIVLLSQ